MSTVVERLSGHTYAVTIDGRRELVYVAKAAGATWASCRGEVFVEKDRDDGSARMSAARSADVAMPITAPMPATVLKLIASPGAAVKKGDTLVILEAMKMELPLRASSDGTVTAVHCTVGQLVQPDTVLVELS